MGDIRNKVQENKKSMFQATTLLSKDFEKS